jgi:hypothetical protein
MKNIIKAFLLSVIISPVVVSCDDDNIIPLGDTELPAYVPVKVAETFSKGADNSLLNIAGWTNFNEVGTKKWMIQVYSGNGYAEFNPYASNELSNVGWLVTPELDLNDGKAAHTLTFRASQSYVSSSANSLEVLISTDYNGTNVLAATWTPLNATLPTTSSTYFAFIESGSVDLSAYAGQSVHVAFKVSGSGTNTALDGAYQIDNVIVQ